MSKALIIAEKPSVAADIARALGGFTRQGDYFESDDYVLSSAIGHLVEIAAPEQYEVKRGKWSFAHLPVIPPHFDLHPIERTEDRLKLLTRLIKRKDVSRLINACDAGREGELIFRLIVQYAKARQPVQRLWLQSMTPAAIREGFAQLRDDAQMLPLADAARSRSEADWLVGINGTRAMTAFNSRDGGFYKTTVGRVQTPTLAIVVEREERIKRFVPREYFEVKATFSAEAGTYEARWFDPAFKRSDAEPDGRAERLWQRGRGQSIVDRCRDKPGRVSEESRPSTQLSPALFDLTSLQREANSRFGFSARTTLSIAQALYERHKLLTYPRTDSRALPEDYLPTVRQTLDALKHTSAWGGFAQQILGNDWVRPNKRVFDNAKVSDHFAIIPTLLAPKASGLSEAEQKVYDLVVRRFLSVFFPAAEYLVTTRITTVEGESFKTEGKVLVDPGWLAIYGREGAADATLVPVKPNERVLTSEIELQALATKPPARYTEATLLAAMEGAGKLIDDDDLREAMAEKGLGTPATRAAIIEGLITENYLVREGRDLAPTTKAFQLLTLLRGLGVSELTAPELTGEWEYKLAQMERGRLGREEFMREIAEMTRQIVERAKNYQLDTVPGDYATLAAPCPKCGAVVQETYKRFACTKCDFSITRIPGGRQLEVAEAEQLLREGTIGPLQGFRSRLGRPFAAILKLTPEHKLEFDFGQDGGEGSAEPVDFGDQQPVGPCPKCGAGVYEHGMSYVCEKSVGPARNCDFRSGKVILQQEVSREQMHKLLAEGRTDLLQGFVSARTRRGFKAFLVRGADGKIGFEFEPRPARAGKGARATAEAGTVAQPPAATGAAAAAPRRAAKKATARKTGPRKAAASKAAPQAIATKATGTKAAATRATGAKAAGTRAPAAKAAAPRKRATGKTAAARPAAARNGRTPRA
ncbi:MAG: DNA topoisomerase III [Lautropia sp.]|nr:DNA topoisomerase III [Lautropia sp.]MCL4702927.1 DNA topoisomerase III [Burkholderiaceae bacterium]MDL1908009.1 DNA topoisomerase III [Betaproteobacteria bacterium PRO1]MEB2335763.1 DNA topoisomerase III [Burkholderiales bacterium]